jgi:hypothetical protein
MAGLCFPKSVLASEEVKYIMDSPSEANPLLGFRPFYRVWGNFHNLKVPTV